MALFELENGRLVPAQFGHVVPDGFSEDVLQAVRSQVLEIVSRPLFPITWEGGSEEGSDAPRLTALDAAGQVVAVEVVRLLDADILIDALSRLADSAAMSWTDLARHYPHGIEGFKAGWARFRESMPTSPPNGPRMVLVAAEITPEVRPALDVLSSSGVEVHEMSLRRTSNGRAFLEVDPVGQRLYNHRFTPVVESGNPVPTLDSSGRSTRRSTSVEGEPAPDVMARRRDPDAPAEPEKAAEKPAPAATQVPVSKRPVPTTTAPGGMPTRASRLARRRAQEPVVSESIRPLPSRRARRAQMQRAAMAEVRMDPVGLRSLAVMLGTDTPLSLRPAHRTPEGAVLTLEGRVLVPAGAFSDPTQALRAAGIYGEDGWTSWHLGDEAGPTLRESIDEVNRGA